MVLVFKYPPQNKGQVVDSAMVDGVAYLSSFLLNTRKLGIWEGQ